MNPAFEPKLTMVQSTRAIRFHHPCGICGGEASIGTGCRLLEYIRQKDKGMEPDRKLLGQWRCSEHQES